ncbi:hypothetical protein SAMN02910447_03071 [Ruminococcus sp. YE71]|nr:hypothetical protein SAMN02910446_03143 [Ruminococcus sp. YE78]SFW48478.1 hypothetical protein SAMN02910447_03071 [Ruminococcus sp. YE71]
MTILRRLRLFLCHFYCTKYRIQERGYRRNKLSVWIMYAVVFCFLVCLKKHALRRTEMPSDATLILFLLNYPKKTTAAQKRSEPLLFSALFLNRRFHLKPTPECDLNLDFGHYSYTFNSFPDRHIVIFKERATVLFQLVGDSFQHQPYIIAVI